MACWRLCFLFRHNHIFGATVFALSLHSCYFLLSYLGLAVKTANPSPALAQLRPMDAAADAEVDEGAPDQDPSVVYVSTR